MAIPVHISADSTVDLSPELVERFGITVLPMLVTLDGEAVEMPSGFDEFSPLADRDYSDVSDDARGNAERLEQAMTAAGFRGYHQEWWHYSDTTDYPVIQ